MDEVGDAELLEVLHARRSTGNDEELFGILELLPCLRREVSILVVRRTEDDDVRFRLAGCLDTFGDGSKTVVVDDLVSCAGEEVTTELRTRDTHSEVTDGEHERNRLFLSAFRFETELFKLFRCTGNGQCRNLLTAFG